MNTHNGETLDFTGAYNSLLNCEQIVDKVEDATVIIPYHSVMSAAVTNITQDAEFVEDVMCAQGITPTPPKDNVIFDGDVEWTSQEDGGITLYMAEFPLTEKPEFGFPTLTLNGVEYGGEYDPTFNDGEGSMRFFSAEPHTGDNLVAEVQFPHGEGMPYQIVTIVEPQSHITITMEEPDWLTLYSGTVVCASDGGGAYNGTFQSSFDSFFPNGLIIKGTVNGVSYPVTAASGDQCFFDGLTLVSLSDGSVRMDVSAAGDYVVDFKYVIVGDDGGDADPR